jgi:hypothetical protein
MDSDASFLKLLPAFLSFPLKSGFNAWLFANSGLDLLF